MTERTNLDRDLASYFAGRSTSRAPAGLLEAALSGVEQTRQRAGWQLTGRRLAGNRSGRWVPPSSARLVLVVVLLAVALAIGLIFIAGSQRRLPPPFGPARPGLMVVDISGHIGLMKPDGTGLTTLTSGPEVDRYPIWSPDGTRFAFVSSHDTSLALVVMDADGRHRTTLADHLAWGSAVRGSVTNYSFGSDLPMSWSPDGRRIAFTANVGHGPQLFVTPTDRPGAVRIGPADLLAVEPSWSPDGSLISFRRVYPCCGGPPDALWVIRPDGEAARELSATPRVKDALTGVAWAPDGSRLAFLADGPKHGLDVYVIDADGAGPRDITNTPEDEQWASWSPDGQRLAVSWYPGADGTYVIDADGSNRVAVSTDGHDISNPAWSPDGSRIVGYIDENLSNSPTDGFLVLDPSGHDQPTFIADPEFGSVTWQRLAP